ncbi:3-hydroxy-2-methylbutyryl-CoA dehydrogenase [Pandoraea iniqua]|uniref:SDR family NAD(P)-dependent oxidoreductase n=1 Tax=Pandoraea iniqua TaxID=2508288 RepID=UPI001241F08E|nr:SDR family NAD(P)-dependent oxidoreductase [Pandoraea iniqua]VVE39343.1 3-hydroxy-2-methylbutyryl-CoA dehydrogenase [Pandoraea iniqua]
MEIQGNVFLITGGASGLGAAAARWLAGLGAKVALADVNIDEGEALAEKLGGKFIKCDVTREDDGKAAVAAAQTLGTLRGLINCAGIAIGSKTVGREGPHPLDAFSRVIQINLIGTFNMIRLAATAMSQAEPNGDGERGVIVNTASVAAYDGQMGQAAYAASKGGVASLTLPVARDLSRSGIRVMTIAPGIFETPMMLAMPPDVQASLGQMVPFPPRLGKPSEYAMLVEQIVRNPMLNGEVIRLDGAIRMQPK